MKFNVKCCLRPAVALVTLMLWLGACAMGGSDMTLSVCPPVMAYSQAELDRAADEIEGLPKEAILTGMLSDYAVLREQVRACG